MKYFMLILVNLIFYSCGKDIEDPPNLNSSKININNISYIDFNPSLNYFPSPYNYYTLNFKYYNADGLLRKSVQFKNIKLNLQIQKLSKTDTAENIRCSYSTYMFDGDVAGNYYYLNEYDDFDDFFQFTKIDTVNNEYEGTFQASFIVNANGIIDLSEPSETILINKGEFTANIE